MTEIEAIKALNDALSDLSDDERSRVLAWAQSKYGSKASRAQPEMPREPSTAYSAEGEADINHKKRKSTKRSKSIISVDKTLNLNPSGKKSAFEFGSEKAPSNVKEKCVVAVYYLTHIVEMEKVSAQGVFTFFKTLSWPAPADLKNTLQQAGTEGWLDTKDGDDIKLTSMGENLVEHDLPRKPKSK